MAVRDKMQDPSRERREPGRVPAIFLAVLVHVGFIALLVFGVNWQSSPPELVQVELWSKLPPQKIEESAPEPTPEPPKPEPPKPEPPKPEPLPEPKVEPPRPSKAEIELKEKLDKEHMEKVARERKEKIEREKREQQEKKRKEEEAKKLAQQKADAARARQEAAAKQAVLDDWINRIKALVKSRANVPDTVTGKPLVQVRLKLLVNGVVFEAQIAKPSGNRAYDEAVERAVAGIRQWPVPSDPDVLRNNREIILNIEHEK